MPREADQLATRRAAEDARDAINVKHGLEARRAFELANMSPDIRPEHYAQCITQTLVAVTADSDGTYLVDVHPEERATRPTGATRVSIDYLADGTRTKAIEAEQPPERTLAADNPERVR